MRVLALDAATELCSVALLSNGECLVRSIESGKSNAQQLLQMVAEVMAEGQVQFSGLDGIAASIGPGAFTGVRISVAVAQGLAFGADLSVAPITTLSALALQAARTSPLRGEARIIACLDARMGELYWGCFTVEASIGVTTSSVVESGAPGVDAPDAIASRLNGRYVGIGRGFSVYPQLAQIPGVEVQGAHALALPNAREIARLGALRFGAAGGIDPADLKPLYLRNKVALTEIERAAR
ncbi:MAG: tRNA (adenosine(37)-N6)-threonylcarbamoyltransferase complex dimerization subunit type 1 TsaB [Pseudomonadota bacterium]|nr:tRNA (adenosine(37)-N6)-threonylcarbamoyltransferase complex dimerization subunit type 1 TsaB [Pseudomonadota bacterium]